MGKPKIYYTENRDVKRNAEGILAISGYMDVTAYRISKGGLEALFSLNLVGEDARKEIISALNDEGFEDYELVRI